MLKNRYLYLISIKSHFISIKRLKKLLIEFISDSPYIFEQLLSNLFFCFIYNIDSYGPKPNF